MFVFLLLEALFVECLLAFVAAVIAFAKTTKKARRGGIWGWILNRTLLLAVSILDGWRRRVNFHRIRQSSIQTTARRGVDLLTGLLSELG